MENLNHLALQDRVAVSKMIICLHVSASYYLTFCDWNWVWGVLVSSGQK